MGWDVGLWAGCGVMGQDVGLLGWMWGYGAGRGVMGGMWGYGQDVGLWGGMWGYGVGCEVTGQVMGLTPMTSRQGGGAKGFIGHRWGDRGRGVAWIRGGVASGKRRVPAQDVDPPPFVTHSQSRCGVG